MQNEASDIGLYHRHCEGIRAWSGESESIRYGTYQTGPSAVPTHNGRRAESPLPRVQCVSSHLFSLFPPSSSLFLGNLFNTITSFLDPQSSKASVILPECATPFLISVSDAAGTRGRGLNRLSCVDRQGHLEEEGAWSDPATDCADGSQIGLQQVTGLDIRQKSLDVVASATLPGYYGLQSPGSIVVSERPT